MILRYKNILELLFVVLILITVSGQLRFFDSIGFGVIGLLIFFISSIYVIIKDKLLIRITSNIFIKFWIINYIVVTLGFIYSFNNEIHFYEELVIHDFLAYIFIIIILSLFLVLDYYKIYFLEIVEKYLYYFILFSAIALCIANLFHSLTSNMIFNHRYQFLSLGPNQFALVLVCLPFFNYYFYKYSRYKVYSNYEMFIGTTLILLILSFSNQSSALSLSYFVGFMYLLFIYLIQSKYKIWIYIISFLICLIVVYELSNITYFLYHPGEVNERLILIKNGLNSFLLSPIIGLGPGPHSFIPTLSDREVHCTPIDIITQSGIIGFCAYVYLLIVIAFKLYRVRSYIMLAAFLALTTFSMFHYVLRQPIFWFLMFLFWQIGQYKIINSEEK